MPNVSRNAIKWITEEGLLVFSIQTVSEAVAEVVAEAVATALASVEDGVSTAEAGAGAFADKSPGSASTTSEGGSTTLGRHPCICLKFNALWMV